MTLHDLKSGRQLAALDAIEADFDNVRAAWRFAVDEGDFEALDQMADSLFWFCAMRSRMPEAMALFDYARANLHWPADQLPPRILRRMLGEDYRLSIKQQLAELKQAKAYALQHPGYVYGRKRPDWRSEQVSSSDRCIVTISHRQIPPVEERAPYSGEVHEQLSWILASFDNQRDSESRSLPALL